MRGPTPLTAQRGASYLDVIGRLKDGVTPETAQAEMARIHDGLSRQYPENRPKGISIVRELDAVVGEMCRGLFLLFGAVGLVLLIACVNLSNLLLAKAASRSKEISIRMALGATQSMIVRQLLIESVVLATAGAALGLAFASWVIQLLTRLAPGELPRVMESGFNLQVLAFTGIVALATSVTLVLTFE
jgi:putative ABC transport system permease protein